MNFENKLLSGQFIKRYKRFFVDIKLKNEIVTAHCPNTGSMHGLLKKGNKVWLTKSGNPNRKLKYTLQIIEDNKSKVGVNTHLANKIVLHGLTNNLIQEFSKNRLGELPIEYKRFDNPHIYKVGLSKKLMDLRNELIKTESKIRKK